MVRSQLEYANSAWNPHSKEDIEKVEMRATKLVESVKHLITRTDEKNLKFLLQIQKREVFKIITKQDNNDNCTLILHKDLVTREKKI